MMAYTTQQYIAELERRKKSFDKARIIASCALAAHDSQTTRMWGGENQLNSQKTSLVKYYSIKPIYIGKFQSPKKINPIGKTGKTTFKSTGEKHKTQYYPLGYAQFKADIKRPMLELFGRLKKDYSKAPQKSGDSYVTGVNGEENIKKYKRLLKMENVGEEAFKLTKDEKTKYSNCINAKLNNILRGQNV
jgi:hypothetical protein